MAVRAEGGQGTGNEILGAGLKPGWLGMDSSEPSGSSMAKWYSWEAGGRGGQGPVMEVDKEALGRSRSAAAHV